MLGQMAIILSLIFVAFVVDQSALAYSPNSSQNEFLDFQPYTGNRLIVFNDTSIDYCITNNQENPAFNHIAANAIKTWHDRIVEVTNNPFVWDMTLHVYPKDESVCDGFVNYIDTPDPTLFQLSGVAGFSHPLTPVANVTIYTDDYQSTLLNMAQNDDDFWNTLTLEKFEDIVKNNDHKQFDRDVISRITLHEIGHSLSLNHPVTSDGNLQNSKGIMGYNMSYNQIEDEEVIQIVKAYPNGFSLNTLPGSIKLDEPNIKQTVNLGEVTNLTIELPYREGKLHPEGLELYIFPEGTSSQKPQYAPIKILKTNGMNHLVNDGEYLEDIRVSMTHWDTFSKVLSVQFKVVKEFENADMIVVAHSVGGFEKQWFLDDVMAVEQALFSNLLLDLETTDYTYYLMSTNPNRDFEEQQTFKSEQKESYNQALAQCLKEKNMKKCNEDISFDDFKQNKNEVPIWMPIYLSMN
jgi:hypothetical protein